MGVGREGGEGRVREVEAKEGAPKEADWGRAYRFCGR